ncbi:MAG: hypothetical protein IJP86_11425 [Synergistaceae bacterium]|nr:hypothetical protein [Synergistaceae bacterium]
MNWLVKDFGSPNDRTGAAFAKQLEGLLRKYNVKILLNTKAEHILMNNGKSVGTQKQDDIELTSSHLEKEKKNLLSEKISCP